MDKKRPQLSADELLQLKWLLGGVLTLVALSTVLYMDIEAWTLTALTAAAAIAVLVRPTLPARVPPLVHTLAFPVIVTLFAVDLWLWTEVLPAMVRLDIMLLLYRTLGYRQRRDDLQIIILGLFLIIVAGVITVSLLFAVQLLAYTACALAFLLIVTLTEGAGQPAGKPAPNRIDAARMVPAWALHVDWPQLFRRLRAVADWRVLGLGTVLFAGVVAVSALLFMAIPRFQLDNSMFLDRFMSKKARSGFSDIVKAGEVTEIQQDNSIALSVDVSDTSQIPAVPYWRMLVLDDYRNGTFKLSPELRSDVFGGIRTTSQLPGSVRAQLGTPVYWTFYLESGISRYLPLLGPYEVLRFMEPQNVARAPDINVVSLRDEPVTMTAYRVLGFQPGAPLPDPRLAARLAGRVEGTPVRFPLQNRLYLDQNDRATLDRVLAEITGGTELPATEFAARVGAWLRRRHGYSLSPEIPAGEGDPFVRWLTSTGSGHCELFAGSFVLLARSAGYSARVITGFKGGSWNTYSNSFTIRNSDAHAWAEIFDAGAGLWHTTDPLEAGTAAQAAQNRGEAALARRMDNSWSARFESLRVFWYRRIVNFDQRTQLETLRSVKEATQSAGKRFRETLDELSKAVREWLGGPWDVRRVGQSIGGIAVLAVVVWGIKNLGAVLAAWRGRRGGRHEDPLRREAGRLLLRVEELGVAGSSSAAALAPVQMELQRIRFGARETWSHPEQVLQRARRAVKVAQRNAPI